MPVTRAQYIGTIGRSDNEKLKGALDRAYAQRSFEIEHYWKRATFFWGFQAAIFVAFGFVWKEPSVVDRSGIMVLSLSSLGILTAMANHLSALGSKFWQENWEKHIDMLEDAVEGRLYKTVWLSDGKRQYSVSGVNLKLSFFFIIFWLFVASYSLVQFLDLDLCNISVSLPIACAVPPRLMCVIGFFLLTSVGAFRLLAQTSKLKGTIPTLEGKRGEAPPIKCRLRRKVDKGTILLRRDAPDQR